MTPRRVFVAGGTGYIGRRFIRGLILRGHTVRALAREGSIQKLPKGVEVVKGSALERQTYASRISPSDTFVHLVGVSHPSPFNPVLFRSIDFVAARESVEAARETGIGHFVFVSVAHPAPVMKEYIRVRRESEALIAEAGLNATILRPWYVLGPGHRWPYLLLPAYKLLEALPSTRESARRLGMIRIDQMVEALVRAVERPIRGIRIVEVPQLKVIQPPP